MGQRRRFTPEFKRQAVQLLNAGQRPAAEIARELGIPRNRLYKWQKEVAAHGGAFPGSGRQAEPAAELARLKRELARVTEERDILKKAAGTLPGSPREIRVYSRLRDSAHRVTRLCAGPRRQSQRLLCLAASAPECPAPRRISGCSQCFRQLHQADAGRVWGDQAVARPDHRRAFACGRHRVARLRSWPAWKRGACVASG